MIDNPVRLLVWSIGGGDGAHRPRRAAAELGILFDQDRLASEARRLTGCRQAGATTTDNYDIEIVAGHGRYWNLPVIGLKTRAPTIDENTETSALESKINKPRF